MEKEEGSEGGQNQRQTQNRQRDSKKEGGRGHKINKNYRD